MDPTQLQPLELPPGVASRYVDTSPIGLKFHILESIPLGLSGKRPPLILLVHGFPNLAYDWRHVMPKLASAGYYAVAFDQRGFGRTHNADLSALSESGFRPLALVRDVVTLVHALGYTSIHTLVGHDIGAVASTLCALSRSDLIKGLVLMTHPFRGPPKLPLGNGSSAALPAASATPGADFEVVKDPNIHTSLLKLDPPRKHYKWYNISPEAPAEWSFPTGEPLYRFLRGYFHTKSGDCKRNKPRPLASWTADELAVMPHYYIMRADLSVRENIELEMSQEPQSVIDDLENCSWFPPANLEFYTQEWSRTTFSDALKWYRVLVDPATAAELNMFASSKIRVPTKYIVGTLDWGAYQEPGALEAMEQGLSVEQGCYRGTRMVEGSGHWINMEKPDECVSEILDLANSLQ